MSSSLARSTTPFTKAFWQQAAAQGITVLVASGRLFWGSAGCDSAGIQASKERLSRPNGAQQHFSNISVGGTDFYMPNGGATFWNSTNNSTTEASGQGTYIPETPLEPELCEPCPLHLGTFAGQTPEQVCNSSTAASYGLLSVIGGGGGPSACIQSNGSSSASCGGGYPKPSWQTGNGVPSDNVLRRARRLTDHERMLLRSFLHRLASKAATPVSPALPARNNFAGYGGTSVSTPAMAGILSLVNQKAGNRVGNANYVLYNLASQQNKAGTACNAITGTPAGGCVFNDVTTNTIAMPCHKGTPNCTVTNSGDSYGVPALRGYAAVTDTILRRALEASMRQTLSTTGPTPASSPVQRRLRSRRRMSRMAVRSRLPSR